jgi:hypothetical protein
MQVLVFGGRGKAGAGGVVTGVCRCCSAQLVGAVLRKHGRELLDGAHQSMIPVATIR